MAEFTGTIEIGYYTDLWGPYFFIFPVNTTETSNDGIIPYGDTISAVTPRVFIGSVKRKSTLSSFTEITDTTIDPSYSPAISDGNTVLIKLQYPGSDYTNSKATILFEIDLASGGKKSFYFQYIKIMGKES